MDDFEHSGDPSGRRVAGIAILLGQMRAALRARHYSPHTEKAYLAWVRRLVAASGRRHPIDLKRHEVATFLSRLASRDRVSASTQIQASCALSFLFRKVLGRSMVEGLPRARPRGSRRVPSVLSHQEVEGVLAMLRGPSRLMAALLYGAGLRLGECCRLQVQDLDLESRQVFVRGGKGAKDRTTLLPERLVEPLRRHLARVHRIYLEDARQGVRRRSPPCGVPPCGTLARAGRREEDGLSPLGAPPQAPAAWAGDGLLRLRVTGRQAPSSARTFPQRAPARLRRRGPGGEAVETRQLPHPEALLRDAAPRDRARHPDDPGAARASRRGDHAGLHPKRPAGTRRPSPEQPPGRPGRGDSPRTARLPAHGGGRPTPRPHRDGHSRWAIEDGQSRRAPNPTKRDETPARRLCSRCPLRPAGPLRPAPAPFARLYPLSHLPPVIPFAPLSHQPCYRFGIMSVRRTGGPRGREERYGW
jgi:hypothetical protein